MKKILFFHFILFLFFCRGIGQNIFYYSSSGDKINLIVDSTIQYVKVLDDIDSSAFLHELESIAELTHLPDQICCRINNHNISAFNYICRKHSNTITHKSAQLMFSKDSSIVWATDVVVVGVKPGLDIADILSSNRINYVSISPVSAISNEFFIKLFPDSDAIDIANRLFQTGDFIYAQPTFVRQNSIQNPLFSYQWSLINTGQYCDTSGFDIRVTDAWNLTQGDSSIIVAVIDEGCDLYHEDLQNNLLAGKNLVYPSENGMEIGQNYHGTPCAGIIAAEDNEIGVVGIAPKCKILPLVNAKSNRETVDTASIRAFTYLLDSTNVSVASCSWGNGDEISCLTNAIQRFITNGRDGKGGIVVFSAGNFGHNNYDYEIIYPGSHLPDCITVGAICPDGTRKVDTSCVGPNWWGSSYGNGLCVMAPGAKIATTMTNAPHYQFNYIGDNYVSDFCGTSAACPHVAGIAALVLSANPNLSGRKVKEIIERTCTKVRQDIYDYDSIAPHGTWDYQMGYGLVNAYQAVLMAQGCKDYPYCTIDTIHGNVSWNTPITVGKDLVIDSLSTLTVTDTVAFYSEARIIVRPGGALVVNGGTITNACDGEMWQGIVVEGDSTQRQQASRQGAVYLTNATVENAHTAISTRGAAELNWWTKTGGIIQATNTLFHNNCSTAEFFEYENHKVNGDVTNNVSYFTRCNFTIDDNNLFAENNTYFLYQCGLTGVRGVKFNGCTFGNETTIIEGLTRGSAIYTEEAGFLAKRVCPALDGPQDPCYCAGTATDTVTRCSFSGFYKAIHAANDNAAYEILIDNCDFCQNHIGVELDAANNARVSFCDFDLSDSISYCGVILANTTGYTVESNVFHGRTLNSTCFGVRVNNSGTADNVIRKNVFSALNKACYASGLNGSMASGLHFECNTFNNGFYDIYGDNVILRKYHGSSVAGADNTFSRPMTSSLFLTSSSKSIEYWYSSASGHIPYNPSSNVTLHNRASANACSSSLCGLIPLEPEPRGLAALALYRLMAEELSSLIAEYAGRGYSEEDEADNAEADALMEQMSDLSAAMGDLSRTAIRTILSDSVVDMSLLKEWYRTIVETMCTSSLQQQPGQNTPVPVAAYQLSEVYSTERDWTAAREVLSSIPVRFVMDSVDADEYRNYLALQLLRENVEGNWYRQSQPEIAELQGVAEHNDGRAARMAKEILCFFHHICYEDEPLLELEGIGERGARGDGAHRAATTAIITGTGTLTLYPNPAHNTLTVESDSPIREITVYDQMGRTVTVETCHGASLQQVVNITSLPAGIYLLNVITEKGAKTAKFVKN